MNRKIKKFIFFFSLFFALFFAGLAKATELKYPEFFGWTINDNTTFPEFARYLYVGLVASSGFVAIISVCWGGLDFIISYARGKFLDEAKDKIKSGVLGLTIVLLTYMGATLMSPELVIFKLPELPFLSFLGSSSPNQNPNSNLFVFNEIPVGVLTENVLTKKTDCYDFDLNGDPIDGDVINTDNVGTINGPTYLSHDRVDCIAKILDGAQKKADLINTVSKKIKELMDTCSCEGKCDSPCMDNNPNPCGFAPACKGVCSNAKCGNNAYNKDGECCDKDTKDQIEHGPLEINNGCTDDNNQEKQYKGLDEFRSQFGGDYFAIKAKVEISPTPKLKGKEITVINTELWKKIRLVDQLTYFKGKIEEIKNKIKDDSDNLQKATSTLGSPQCYISTSYVDLLKRYYQTKNQNTVIIKNPILKDPETQENISIAKYCNAFNYGNSTCYSKCLQYCSPSTQGALSCYASCGSCEQNDAVCLEKQNMCVKDCFNNKNSCPNGPYANFSNCIDSCRGDCSKDCESRYSTCSDEYKNCVNQCKSNSQCVMENQNQCLFNSPAFQYCGANATDTSNANFCIDNAFKCKFGSLQYAGYYDCLKTPSNLYSSAYSSSNLYQHPEAQLCPNPFEAYNNSSKACVEVFPQTAKCPASSKCPQCPCDILSQTETFSTQNNGAGANGQQNVGPCNGSPLLKCKDGTLSCNCNNNGTDSNQAPQQDEGEIQIGNAAVNNEVKITIKDYRVVGPECGQYLYNDDPLTFYCQQSWWDDPALQKSDKPQGKERKFSLSGEVPVGKTVDDTFLWVSKLKSTVDNASEELGNMISFLNKVGHAQNYCKCTSVWDTGKPICTTTCQYVKGNDSASSDMCNVIPCNGNSCKQIMNYLDQVSVYANQVKLGFINFYRFAATGGGRSDILKELTYSRNQANNCSLVGDNFGQDAELLNCKRVQQELGSPINGGSITVDSNGRKIKNYCYGQELGTILGIPMTDNWFCGIQQDTSKQESNNN